MAQKNRSVAVLVPFYKAMLTDYENIALQQCFKILSGHPVIAIKPALLTLPTEIVKYPFAAIVSFDEHFFKGIAGYNRLMLSDVFYRAFTDYEFILIYQTDAFVFDDQLDFWCQQKFDYIGAPWLKDGEHPDIVKTVKSSVQYYLHTRYNIQKDGEPSKYQWENKVGNGGLSLRRVAKFHDLCLAKKDEIDAYLKKDSYHYNEDRFWSIEVNRKRKILNIPDYKTAVKFSFEIAPERALKLNNGHLPFGCHAWDRKLEFWRPIFEKLGYTI